MDTGALNNWFVEFAAQLRRTVVEFVPTEHLPSAWWVMISFVVLGLFFAVFGAVMARRLLTVGLGCVGIGLGGYAARLLTWPTVAGWLIGFVILAVLGWTLYRYWIGLMVALLAGVVALAACGQKTIWPAFLDYQPGAVVDEFDHMTFEIPAPQQPSNPASEVWNYWKGVYDHLAVVQPQALRDCTVIVASTILAGLFFGVVFTRMALILSFALIATVLFNSGLATLAEQRVGAGWENRLFQHPYATLGFLAGFYLLSCLVQWRATQPRPIPVITTPKSGQA